MVSLATVGRAARVAARESRGFSMMELLITIVLAGIIFSAMVPFFANALKKTSADEVRVDSVNIAQDRIEQVRLLNFDDITADSLNAASASFGDGRFGPAYTQVGETVPYQVTYVVDDAVITGGNAKRVTVSVQRGDTYITEAETIVDNRAAGDTSVVDAEPTDLSVSVYFIPWTYVKSPGCWLTCVQTNVTPNPTTTPAPGPQMPTSTNQELTWPGLIGGPNYVYSIHCASTKASYVLNAPPFHLWSNGRWPIDTYPGGD